MTVAHAGYRIVKLYKGPHDGDAIKVPWGCRYIDHGPPPWRSRYVQSKKTESEFVWVIPVEKLP